MRFLLFILSLFILVTYPANEKLTGKCHTIECTSEISQHSDDKDPLPNKELLLSSAQISITILEEGGTPTIAGRQHQVGQNHSAKKTPFKFLKNGKIVDGHRISVWMDKVSIVSGIFSKDRYLFVIRELRI